VFLLWPTTLLLITINQHAFYERGRKHFLFFYLQ
jgi:hypothetical protein